MGMRFVPTVVIGPCILADSLAVDRASSIQQ